MPTGIMAYMNRKPPHHVRTKYKLTPALPDASYQCFSVTVHTVLKPHLSIEAHSCNKCFDKLFSMTF